MINLAVRVGVVFGVLFCLGFGESSASGKVERLSYYFGINTSINRRIETPELEDPAGCIQNIYKSPLTLFGFCIGKRSYVADWRRYNFQVQYDVGVSYEDSLSDFSGLYYSRRYLLNHFGFDADIELVRPFDRIELFVLFGGGINYTRMSEKTVEIDNHSKNVTVSNHSNIKIGSWCPNMQLGFGLDYKITRTFGIGFDYQYRLWKPVKYLDSRNLPKKNVLIEQKFYTHLIHIKFLFNFVK